MTLLPQYNTDLQAGICFGRGKLVCLWIRQIWRISIRSPNPWRIDTNGVNLWRIDTNGVNPSNQDDIRQSLRTWPYVSNI